MKKILFGFILSLAISAGYGQCNVVICNATINFALDSNGEGTLYPDIVDAGSYDNCEFEVAIFDATNMMELVPFGDTISLDCDLLGDQVYRLRDIATQNQCWGNISIEDFLDVCTSSSTSELESIKYLDNGTELIFSSSEEFDKGISVFDLSGRLVLYEDAIHNTIVINKNRFPNKGMYVVGALVNGKWASEKIVVW